MDLSVVFGISFAIAAIAFLYSSVGHGGASGYLAIFGLFGIATVVMRPAALSLNILVSSLACWHFLRAGYFSKKLFIPLILASAPAAFLGGYIQLDAIFYRPLVGGVLLFACWKLFQRTRPKSDNRIKAIATGWLVMLGILIGFLSGLTGVGGGIFLSPILLLGHFSDIKTTSGIASLFILVNSIFGLTGNYMSLQHLPVEIIYWLAAAGIGGFFGSRYGKNIEAYKIRKLLALVLFMAGLKMIFL